MAVARKFTGSASEPVARKSRSDFSCDLARETPKIEAFDSPAVAIRMASKARSPARPGSAGSQVIVRNEGEGAGGRRGYYSYSPAPYGRDWDLELGGRDRPLPRRSGLGRVFGRADDTPVPLVYYSAWRLRWCALLLLIGTATQAISVGSAVNADSCRGLGESGLWIAIGVLAAMVLALWALLSQLLLWSDAAVLRVPQNVALAEQPGVNYAGSGESAQL